MTQLLLMLLFFSAIHAQRCEQPEHFRLNETFCNVTAVTDSRFKNLVARDVPCFYLVGRYP